MIHVIASFEHSAYLELAITALIKNGVPKEKILAVPLNLEKSKVKKTIFDTIHRADGVSVVDGAMALGTVGMVLGTIYGFVLSWGPVLWALLGLLGGAVLGFILDLLINKRRQERRWVQGKSTEVVLLINCSENQLLQVEDILWQHYPQGVGILNQSREGEHGDGSGNPVKGSMEPTPRSRSHQ